MRAARGGHGHADVAGGGPGHQLVGEDVVEADVVAQGGERGLVGPCFERGSPRGREPGVELKRPHKSPALALAHHTLVAG